MFTSITVIFDGVKNSVFQSQVLEPLLKQCDSFPRDSFALVSFEWDLEEAKKVLKRKSLPVNLTVKFYQRFPYLGFWTLLPLFRHFGRWLDKNLTNKITCRGPFATAVALGALRVLSHIQEFDWVTRRVKPKTKAQDIDVNVLIPGIASEESWLVRSYVSYWLIKSLENKVYNPSYHSWFFLNEGKSKVKYSVVSSAMAEYFQKTFLLNTEILSYERRRSDIEEKLGFRVKVRADLGIQNSSLLYVYSGSLKPWQGFELSLGYFKDILSKQSNAKLLILTLDVSKATILLKRSGLDANNCFVLSVRQNQVHQYLLACDYGLLLRESNIVNWTARPVKAMEYLDAGLIICHNHTVHWVIENC